MTRISRLFLKGFKSIECLEGFQPSQRNLMIGPNGVGKSNFIGFFRMLSWCVNSPDQFQNYLAEAGGGSAFLHEGPETTREIEWNIEIETQSGWNEYAGRLVHGAGDILFFADEKVRFSRSGRPKRNPRWTTMGGGHRESKLYEFRQKNETAKVTFDLLRRVIVYQFHNTSTKAPIRNRWNINDGKYLKENGANLGSFLYHLFSHHAPHYKRVVEHLRVILPFFEDFVLEPDGRFVLLQWKERQSPKLFDASLASDGMLRFMALTALLNQPPGNLPAVMFLDEPELGLHPAAIEALAGMLKTVSRNCQLFISTQSPVLVDYFEPEDIVVVERQGRASEFKHLSRQELQAWLEDYSLSELWEKNLIGGQP